MEIISCPIYRSQRLLYRIFERQAGSSMINSTWGLPVQYAKVNEARIALKRRRAKAKCDEDHGLFSVSIGIFARVRLEGSTDVFEKLLMQTAFSTQFVKGTNDGKEQNRKLCGLSAKSSNTTVAIQTTLPSFLIRSPETNNRPRTEKLIRQDPPPTVLVFRTTRPMTVRPPRITDGGRPYDLGES